MVDTETDFEKSIKSVVEKVADDRPEDLIEGLQAKCGPNNRIYNLHISKINFPEYKNLAPGTTLEFQFPVTVLVGENGANKSSILRALLSCSPDQMLGKTWFDTKVDEIFASAEGERVHPRFFYEYRASDDMNPQVMLHRSFNSKNLDYWESTEPRRRDGMAAMPEFPNGLPVQANKTRWKKINTPGVYYDPRMYRSAFDTFLYGDYWDPALDRLLGNAEKKERIRHAATILSDVFEGGQEDSGDILEGVCLSKEAVQLCSWILDREYEQITVVKHKLYGVVGWAARIVRKGEGLRYSEAYAGAGELSAILLVKFFLEQRKPTIILLDEPEVSLHPNAQKRLMTLMLRLALEMEHQIIISTHSRDIINPLPNEARKLLKFESDSGLVSVPSQSSTPDQAFAAIGMYFDKKRLYVEDRLAEVLVRQALWVHRKDALNSISIVVGGGALQLQSFIGESFSWSEKLEFEYFLLDGDCKPHKAQRKGGVKAINHMPDYGEDWERMFEALNKFGFVKEKKEGAENDPLVSICHNRSAPKSEQIPTIRKLYGWLGRRVAFLPGVHAPEVALLSEVIANLDAVDIPQKMKNSLRKAVGGEVIPTDSNSVKSIWANVARDFSPADVTSAAIFEKQKQVIELLESDSKLLKDIYQSVKYLGLA